MGTAVMLDALQTPRLLLMPGTTQGSGANCSPPASEHCRSICLEHFVPLCCSIRARAVGLGKDSPCHLYPCV